MNDRGRGTPAGGRGRTGAAALALVLGGVGAGTVRVEGPVNAADIAAGDPIGIPDLTGTCKPGASARRPSPRAR
ncbi:hypothetical protein ACWD0J_04490 [Streptomyces sp. NPDC003011]